MTNDDDCVFGFQSIIHNPEPFGIVSNSIVDLLIMDAMAIIHHSPCSYVWIQLHLQTLQGAPPTSNLPDRLICQKCSTFDQVSMLSTIY